MPSLSEHWNEIGKVDLETALRALSMTRDPENLEENLEGREGPAVQDEHEGIIRLVVSTIQTASVVRFVKKLRVVPQFRVLRLAPSDHSDLLAFLEQTAYKRDGNTLPEETQHYNG